VGVYRAVRKFASDEPAFDQLAGVVLAGGFLIAHFAGIRRPHVSQATALVVYLTLAAIAAGLLGIVFAAIAIIRSLDAGGRLAILRAERGASIDKAMRAAIKGLGVATLLCLLATFLDEPGGVPVLARALALWAVGLASARVTRLAWLFGLILNVNDADQRRRANEGAASPTLQLAPERRASGE